MRPDHRTLVLRLKREVESIERNHDGRPPAPRIYELRKMRKRWAKERSNYEAQIASSDDCLDISYAKARISETLEKDAILAQLDLTTDEEKRGTKRKSYTRDPLTQEKVESGFGHLTNEQYEESIRRPMLAMVRRRARQDAEFETAALVLGSEERRKKYKFLRSCIAGNPVYLKEYRKVAAKQAAAEKRGEDYVLSKSEQRAVDHVVAVLAQLTELDHEYADVAETDSWNPVEGVFTTLEGRNYTQRDHSVTDDHRTFDPTQ